tara:strand:- start:594 stop:1112 length:519 start_codon:yes stop_codon:yes gene_type:complete
MVGEPLVFDNIEQISGIYLWCIKGDDDVFRVYYVGEAQDIKDRLYVHLSNHLKGLYAGHCVDSLKNNVKILMHRAAEGMIPRFSDIDAQEFNKDFVNNIWIFFATIPDVGEQNENKWNRCRFETAISHQIENGGPNILSVGHLRYWKGEKSRVALDTGDSMIEYLSGEELDY